MLKWTTIFNEIKTQFLDLPNKKKGINIGIKFVILYDCFRYFNRTILNLNLLIILIWVHF
jgi:hypothetical protein